MTGCVTGRPGPLKIEATEMTGDVNHLTDEVKAGHPAELSIVLEDSSFVLHAAKRHFRRPVAFRPDRRELPAVELVRCAPQHLVGLVGQAATQGKRPLPVPRRAGWAAIALGMSSGPVSDCRGARSRRASNTSVCGKQIDGISDCPLSSRTRSGGSTAQTGRDG